jgi:hypothetical protein
MYNRHLQVHSQQVLVAVHFRKELKQLLFMAEQRNSANDRRKDFMIIHNECDLRRPRIEPGSPDA